MKKNKITVFYRVSLPKITEKDSFYPEFNILSKTVEAVNSFHSLYRSGRRKVKAGAATHAQQDLSRAMLIFACAGLDVFVKQLAKTKLPKLLINDNKAKEKFMDYVRRGMDNDDKTRMKIVALALIDHNPREIFLKEYVESFTGESLQSYQELCKISEASGLDTKKIFETKKEALIEAFTVRNQIIHEMDINISNERSKTTGYRTRRQRKILEMNRHTKIILDLAENLFKAYKDKFQILKIEVDKKSVKE